MHGFPPVARMPLGELRPAPYNPRVPLAPTDRRYRKLRRSLERFGLVEPLVWNRQTGHVVGGHQRLQILKELGHAEAPVAIVDLPLEQEKTLNVVLNNREAQSDWDLTRLRDLLAELASDPRTDLADTGFTRGHLDLLREQLAPAGAPMVEAKPTVCEITLIVPGPRYEAVRPCLDALLAETDLECHVRWR
jgi:ParB-like chromosome segregation protein Spo0J